MNREEERLRRAISRGAGESEIRRLLEIVESRRRAETKAPKRATSWSRNSEAVCCTTSSVAVPMVGSAVDIPGDGPRRMTCRISAKVEVEGTISFVSIWSQGADSSFSRIAERQLIERGPSSGAFEFTQIASLALPATVELRWRTLGGGEARSTSRSLTVADMEAEEVVRHRTGAIRRDESPDERCIACGWAPGDAFLHICAGLGGQGTQARACTGCGRMIPQNEIHICGGRGGGGLEQP